MFNAAGMTKNIEKNDIVTTKVYFGERGKMHYLHPSLVREVVDIARKAGSRPFLTDTATLYKQARHTLFDHLQTAAANGFTPETMGCPIIIADGLRGAAGQWVQLQAQQKFTKIKVAQAVYESDVLVVLSHVALHCDTGIAAAVKNVAMGCTTKETKLAMHSSEVKPEYSESTCTQCMTCVKVCPSGTISVPWILYTPDVQKRILDGFVGVTSQFPPQKRFFVNVGIDVTPHCDCNAKNNIPLVPDFGGFASYDAIACDKASYDFITQAVPYPGSVAKKECRGSGDEKVTTIYPEVDMDEDWNICHQSGSGNLEYELITLD